MRVATTARTARTASRSIARRKRTSTRRGATAVQWLVGLFFLTLATATLGTYLGIRLFLYDVSSRMKDDRPALIGGDDDPETTAPTRDGGRRKNG